MAEQPSVPLAGRVALVTGANSGIGYYTALELARQGARVFVACRSAEKARPAADRILRDAGRGVELLDLDLSDLDSVRACAKSFVEKDVPLHLLVNNAGLAGAHGLTKSGFELAFGVNHVGHFLLTHLLLDRIRAATKARIVTVASAGHYRAPGIDFEAVRRRTATRTAFPEYCVSKLANVLFSAELARRLAGTGITTYSLHPGTVATDVWRSVPGLLQPLIKLFMISSEEGAQTSLYCATSPACATETGLYYDKSRVKEPSALARDTTLASELWKRSEEWTA